jgi:cytochrome b561
MTARFPLFLRLLHWTMAAMVLAMLFIGVAMVASLTDYHRLVAIHRPLGILIFVLAVIRLAYRLMRPAPPLPSGMPHPLRLAARISHALLYALMIALPIIGWAMLSAAGNPVVLVSALHLPPILPHDDELYTLLRPLHAALAFLLFGTFLVHLGAAMMHALIFRDGVFQRMASWRR